MTKADAYRIASIPAGHDTNRAPSRAFASLLLLGLTRGCRVRWGAPGGRKATPADAPRPHQVF